MAISSDVFCWENTVGTCDISTVEGNNAFHPQDKTRLSIKSERTGKTEEFNLDRYEKDEEGDITFYLYMPVNKALKEKGVKLMLFND